MSENIGITKEEIARILVNSKLTKPSLIETIYKIIEINNEKLIKYLDERN